MLRITHTLGRKAPMVEHFAVPRLRVGSAPGSELCFRADDGRGVAAQHAEIRWEGGTWQVVDLGAPAGTWVNRARVGRGALRPGDVVGLGPEGPEFRVELASGGGAAGARPPGERGQGLAAPAPAFVAEAQPQPAAADGSVDLATAHRIISDAVARSGGGDEKAMGIVAAKVAAARRRTGRSNMLLTLGLGVTFVAFVATAAFVWDSQRRAAELANEAGLGRKDVPRAKGVIPTKVYTGREIFEENKAAVFLMGWRTGNTIGGSCTAFAIQPTVLVTNAHCVVALKAKGGTPVVTQNDSNGNVRFKIVGWAVHPGYKSGKTSAEAADVGLIRVDGKLPKTMTLANDAELRALGPGDDVFVLGFPGRVMDPVSPSATFLQGHVGRLMALGEQAPASNEDAVLVQHDAVTRGGNSGSPIFNQYGHVVAVHAAHLDDEADVKVDGKQTTVVDASPYRVGMRIDLLKGVPSP
jgi:S1-C subfamily serine protease